MAYTIGQAAKATGRSKPTISRAIKTDAISAVKKDDGSFAIDPAELHRVFPAIQPSSNDNPDLKSSDTPSLQATLQREVELLRERLADKDAVIDDLRERLDREAEERRKLTAILTDQRIKAAPDVIVAPPPASSTETSPPAAKVPATGKRKGWLGWLTG